MPPQASAQDTQSDEETVATHGPFSEWPLVWRLPVAMALIVLIFAIILTHFGLDELERRQSDARVDVGVAFLDTLAGVVAPAVSTQADASDLQDILAASAQFKPSLRNEAVAVCCLPDGTIVVSSSYRDVAGQPEISGETEVALASWIEANRDLPAEGSAIQIVDQTSKLLIIQAYPLNVGAPMLLAAAFDLEQQRADQNELRRTALFFDIALSLVAALITFVLARISLKPIDALTQALTSKRFDPDMKSSPVGEHTEIGRLHTALRNRADLQAKAEALAASETKNAREATLARLAAGLAHEVRNPVAGMSAAASTLRRYGEDKTVRDQTIDLIERGLQSIDHVAASMLSTYRPPEGNRDLQPADIIDLQTLIQPKARVKQIELVFTSELEEAFPASAEALRQIALNLLLNAIDASPSGSLVTFEARANDRHLVLCVADSGSGLPDEALLVLTDGGNVNKPQTRRLGLWLVHQLIDEVGGRLAISTRPKSGTAITITIPKRADETPNA